MPEYIQVAGASKLYIGFPANNYSTLVKIGEQMDETRLSVQKFTHDVPGDSHGGPQGPPIEKQQLGMIVRGQFSLSRWDPAVKRLIESHNVNAVEGRITDAEIGSLLLRDRSFRIVIAPSKSNPIPFGESDAGKDWFFRNFPCCVVGDPVECGQGTKFSVLSFSFEAHRVPVGHYYALTNANNVGVVYNRDSSLVPGWLNGALQ
jgi:hypothetical protein